jgi:hypothetical protein
VRCIGNVLVADRDSIVLNAQLILKDVGIGFEGQPDDPTSSSESRVPLMVMDVSAGICLCRGLASLRWALAIN